MYAAFIIFLAFPFLSGAARSLFAPLKNQVARACGYSKLFLRLSRVAKAATHLLPTMSPRQPWQAKNRATSDQQQLRPPLTSGTLSTAATGMDDASIACFFYPSTSDIFEHAEPSTDGHHL
jgi:hypothetical protein